MSRKVLSRWMRSLILLMSVLWIWEIASHFTLPLFIPSPTLVLSSLVDLAKTGQLQMGLWYSFRRITLATLLSAGVSIPVALVIYGIRPLKEVLMPVVSFLRYTPVTAFSPLLVLWCGIGEEAKISFLFIATFVYFLPSVLLCFEDVPEDLLDTGRTLGMRRWEVITEVLLPASLPSICNTFLLMYGIGWTYVAIVEASNAVYGLGFIITVSSARGRTNVVFAAIIAIMVFSAVFDKLGQAVLRKIFAWKEVSQADE